MTTGKGDFKELADPNNITLRVLRMFNEMGRETLDLHELFEAGGNDPDKRLAVFDAVERLVEQGALEERGNDFYSLTDKGRGIVRSRAGEA